MSSDIFLQKARETNPRGQNSRNISLRHDSTCPDGPAVWVVAKGDETDVGFLRQFISAGNHRPDAARWRCGLLCHRQSGFLNVAYEMNGAQAAHIPVLSLKVQASKARVAN